MKHIKDTVIKLLLLTVVCTTLCLGIAGCKNITYTYSFPVGQSPALAKGINENGTVIFYIHEDPEDPHSYIYSEGSHIALLPPGCDSSFPVAINNREEVVIKGTEAVCDNLYHSCNYITKWFLYSKGSYTELLLPLPPEALEISITNINDSGVMVGWVRYYGGTGEYSKGFQFDGITYKELMPPGFTYSRATHINNNGTVIVMGVKYDPNFHQSVFVYNNGDYTELLPPGWSWVFARYFEDLGSDLVPEGYPAVINNMGVVAMTGIRKSGDYSLSLYNEGIYTELPLPPVPDQWGLGIVDINDNGDFIVNVHILRSFLGYPSWDAGPGFVCHDGAYTKIMKLGWTNSVLHGINNNGDVVGNGGGKLFIASPR